RGGTRIAAEGLGPVVAGVGDATLGAAPAVGQRGGAVFDVGGEGDVGAAFVVVIDELRQRRDIGDGAGDAEAVLFPVGVDGTAIALRLHDAEDEVVGDLVRGEDADVVGRVGVQGVGMPPAPPEADASVRQVVDLVV